MNQGRTILLLLSAAWTGSEAGAQGTPPPRAGLTAQQTQQAMKTAREAMVELRKKTEGATRPEVDRREYVVGVEMLPTKDPESPPANRTPANPKPAPEPTKPANEKPAPGRGPLALVTSYRYFDDITVFSTVDVATGKLVHVEAAQHLRTALSDEEYEQAKIMAKQQSEPVKALHQKFGDKLSAYPQFSQFTVNDDPRIHRVVHLTYRIGAKDLSYPRPVIDLTSREVTTPEPEAFPKPRPAR